MPASNERVPNRPLSGIELRTIIQKDVAKILERDGMFTGNIAYNRVAYEVRVSLHAEIAGMPEYLSTTLSRPASKQEIEADPALSAIEEGGKALVNASDESVVSSTETTREIKSPNASRVEHDMPLPLGKLNAEGREETITYEGDKPDPASVGNRSETKDTSEGQEIRWRGDKKTKRKAGRK